MTVPVFVELIDEPTGVARVDAKGPFPKPYRYAVHFKRGGRYADQYAEIYGFDEKKIAPSDYESIIRSINHATGKLVAYDRAGPPPIRVVQIDPALIKGRILMAKLVDRSHLSKTHIPSPARAQKRDGSINMAVLAADSAKAFALLQPAKGNPAKETMLNVERIVFADGSVLDCFHHIATDALKK